MKTLKDTKKNAIVELDVDAMSMVSGGSNDGIESTAEMLKRLSEERFNTGSHVPRNRFPLLRRFRAPGTHGGLLQIQ